MCIQVKTIFRCNCPYQNTSICPHHISIRSSQDEINAEGGFSEDGFNLRLESALQAHRDWTPLPQDGSSPYPRWDHCAAYKSRYRDVDSDTASAKRDRKGKGKGRDRVFEGKEHVCPNWVRTEESVSRLVRDLCFLCEDRHGVSDPEEDEREEGAQFTVDSIRRRAAESRPSRRSGSGSGRVSTQSPVRKILSQVKQKVIRESLMGSGGGGGSTSRSPSATGEAKESQCDVFSRLQVDASRKRGTSVGSVGSGSRAGTPGLDKGRPSSRQTSKKPAWGAGSGKK